MSDINITTCSRGGCEAPATMGFFCPGHVPGSQPGIIEPEVEARARAAGEAAVRKMATEAQAPVSDMEEPTSAGSVLFEVPPGQKPWRGTPYEEVPIEPEVYILRCLDGSEGIMRQQFSRVIIEVLESALRKL